MLSLAMIVWNEVLTIERAISSVRDVVDEVVVGLDVSSNDGTGEIVHRVADKVVPIYLSEELGKKASVDDDPDWGFAKARNKVLGFCDKKNWRLILDGHEIVLNPEMIINTIMDADKIASDAVEIWMHFEPDKNNMSQTVYSTVRLLSPSVEYKNSIHNAPAYRSLYICHDIIVEHRKREQARKDRSARNVQRSKSVIEGLFDKVCENPNNSRSWFYLGTGFKENRAYRDAIGAFTECLKVSRWDEERWSARINMGTCYSYCDENDKAREQFVLALEEIPRRGEVYYWLANIAYKQKKYREAEVWLLKCIELPIPYSRLFLDPKIYLVDRYDLMSMVYSKQGQIKKAVEYARKALEPGSNVRIENNLRLWDEYFKKFDGNYYDGVWNKKDDITNIEKQKFLFMASRLKSVNRLIDIGSGPGLIMDYLSDDTEIEYVGVDISSVAREGVVEKGGVAVKSLGDLMEMGYVGFDGCVLGDVLELQLDDVGFLCEAVRCLEKNAVVVISVPRFGCIRKDSHMSDYMEHEFMDLIRSFFDVEETNLLGPWIVCSCRVPE